MATQWRVAMYQNKTIKTFLSRFSSLCQYSHWFHTVLSNDVKSEWAWTWSSLTHLPWTKWPPFCRWYFEMHFLQRKDMYCYQNLTEVCSHGSNQQLEQLERLRSEDTPRRLMITHIIESFWIPSQNESRKIWKISEKLTFYNFVINLTHDTPSNGDDYLWQIWK